MLVGPTGGGKTTTRQILKRALVVLPTIQAREQQQPLGTGDYPEENGSLKTSLSFTVRMLTPINFFIEWFSRDCEKQFLIRHVRYINNQYQTTSRLMQILHFDWLRY